MAKVKKLLKAFIPPIIISFFITLLTKKDKKCSKETWSGNYDTWNDAKLNCTGYDNTNVLEKCIMQCLYQNDLFA